MRRSHLGSDLHTPTQHPQNCTVQLETPRTNFRSAGASALARQIFRTKSIDKLISESERPEHALKKTLGPVSLTALGVGAFMGSGIFTVIGVAIGGNPASLASFGD